MNKNAGLKWTNHPLVDVGIATLIVFAEKDSPEKVTFEDLEKFAKYTEESYFIPITDEKGKKTTLFKSYLSVLFTLNFCGTNPSLSEKEQKENIKKLLGSFSIQPDTSLPKCVYCGNPSIKQPTSDLAFRDLVPMVTGRGVINFFPYGNAGLPLCGLCTVAIQAISIGTPKCSGRALIVSSDDSLLTLSLIRKWLPDTKTRIQLSKTTGQKPPSIGRPLTRTIETLLSLERERRNFREDAGLTIFHLSNSGQGPDVRIYNLPSNVMKFVMRAHGVRYFQAWNEIINRSWEVMENETISKEEGEKKKKKRKESKTKKSNPLERRNYLFEDLFTLPEQSARFVRIYLLQKPPERKTENDPRKDYKCWQDAKYIKWDLTELFVKEVMRMDTKRIEAIRNLGDRLSEEIATNNDKKLWRDSYNVMKSYELRNVLIKQSQKCIKAGKEPLIRFEPFLEIFEEGEELSRADWKLAWDLVLIRVIEKLYEKKWFEQNKEVLESEEIKS